jgi:hypothetical protein
LKLRSNQIKISVVQLRYKQVLQYRHILQYTVLDPVQTLSDCALHCCHCCIAAVSAAAAIAAAVVGLLLLLVMVWMALHHCSILVRSCLHASFTAAGTSLACLMP